MNSMVMFHTYENVDQRGAIKKRLGNDSDWFIPVEMGGFWQIGGFQKVIGEAHPIIQLLDWAFPIVNTIHCWVHFGKAPNGVWLMLVTLSAQKPLR